MRRVLVISPHFPPDASAGTHRARLLVPHLPTHGWEPTVLTLEPEAYESVLDPELLALFEDRGRESDAPPPRVVRAPALTATWTRRLGVGDLGLRALPGLHRHGRQLVDEAAAAGRPFDAVLVTVYPTYPALLGPGLARRAGGAFVLDLQDPWVGAWGATVGPGADGRPDAKSRLSRALAARLEPFVVGRAHGVTAVSERTFEDAFARCAARNPGWEPPPARELPIGGDPADFEAVRRRRRRPPGFDPDQPDGEDLLHLVYVGTLLPLGGPALEALFTALARLRRRRPELAGRARLAFVGTSNTTDPDAAPRALPAAHRAGVDDLVTEIPPRVPYLDALTALGRSHAVLLLGSTERHYTASKIYPALLAHRPLLALFHRESTVVDVLGRALAPPSARVVTFGDAGPVTEAVEPALEALLEDLATDPEAAYRPADADPQALAAVSAPALAGRLAGLLDRARERARSDARRTDANREDTDREDTDREGPP